MHALVVYKLHVKSTKATEQIVHLATFFKMILYNKQEALHLGRSRLLKISSSVKFVNTLEVVSTRPDVVKRTLRGVLDSVVVLLPELRYRQSFIVPNNKR